MEEEFFILPLTVFDEAILLKDIVIVVALVRVIVVVLEFIHGCIIPDQGLEVKKKREKTLDDHAAGRKRKDRAEPVEDANQGMEGREQIVLHGHIIPYLVGAGQEVGGGFFSLFDRRKSLLCVPLGQVAPGLKLANRCRLRGVIR